MPSIEITEDQATALAAGRSITIDPPERRYIIVFDNGNVFDVTTNQVVNVNYRQEHDIRGAKCKLIAKGPHACDIGDVQRSVFGDGIAIEVPNA